MIPVSTANSQQQHTVLIANNTLNASSADAGNTIVYQPVTVDHSGGHTTAASAFPAGLIQQLLQQSSQQSQTQSFSVPTQSGNVIMLVQNNGTATPIQLSQPLATQNPIQLQTGVVTTSGTTTTTNAITGAQAPPATEVEEEPLYVNAKQYHRILKRRQDRARLEASGKIPKERRRYLHESRHRHAMNRVRGEGGRFHARDEKESEVKGAGESTDGQQCLNEYFSQMPSS